MSSHDRAACDNCGERDDLHAVGAGLLLVCAACVVPPVFEPPYVSDEPEDDDGE